jgi:hypothetical protein
MSFAHRTRVRSLILCAAALVAMMACGDTGPQPPGTVVVNFSTDQGDENLFVWGVSVDGATPHTVSSNEAAGHFEVAGLAAGEHHLVASSLPAACSSGADDRTVTVPSNDTLHVTFAVKCTRTNGTIRVVTTTAASGVSDPDGYIVTVGTAAIVGAALSGTTDIGVRAGTYDVTLSDIEPNCTVPAKKQTTTVGQGQTAVLTFNFTCGAYATTTPGASVTDPANDTLPNASAAAPAAFDLVGVTTRYAADFMTITLRLSRPLAGSAFVGFIDLDVDENPLTGVAPFVNDPPSSSGANQGVDQYIQFNPASASGVAGLFGVSAETGVALNMIVNGDSIQFILPYEKLHDDGNLTITTIIGANHAMDYAPNSGVITSHASTPAAFTGSTGSPASSHAAQPPTRARALLQPAFLSCRTTRVLVASSCHAQ